MKKLNMKKFPNKNKKLIFFNLIQEILKNFILF
jgi:hypothetical protein